MLLTNLRSLDRETPIVLLFLAELPGIAEHFENRYPNLEIHVYEDTREQRNYIPTIKPYLFWRYLSEDKSREQEDYFQLDSDVIFRALPDYSKMPLDGKVAWASDCGIYIDYNYITKCKNGMMIVDKFAEILNIPVETIRITPGGGAQWIIAKPLAQLWWHIWQDSQIIHDYLATVNTDLQVWTAEMWAQLYNLAKFGWQVKISPELDFCRPTDPIEMWDQTNILHNAGVTGPNSRNLFYKGDYLYLSPFGKDLSYVTREKAGWHYARAIEKAYNHIV